MELRFKKLHAEAVLPERHSQDAAGYDLASIQRCTVPVGQARTINTGIAIELPPGHVAFAFSRSGHGFKHDVSLSNSVGVIDADYRGEIKVRLRNDGDKQFEIEVGDRICQLVITTCLLAEPVFVPELSSTQRGDGGYGSTGR